MSIKTIEAVVLKNINYKDTDKIYTLFSKDLGKISAGAKGVRKISSKRAGNLDSLTKISVGIYESSSGKKTITEVKNLTSYSKIKKSHVKIQRATYISELIHRHTEEDSENNYLYNLFVRTLDILENDSIDADIAVCLFQIFFIQNLGYDLNFSKCSVCFKDFHDFKKVYFNSEFGGFICENCFSSNFHLETQALSKEVSNFLFAAKTTPKNIPPISSEQIREAELLLQLHLRSILERNLVSDFMLEV